eukprot:TRINITY_DN6552_c0_g1_i3.p2 TRINITY_DN6552_c0_g1~~TRINITY_DN6552_c0_g1_i3.p2  ORF type:complete len:103 (-),score=46.17 TRINITY_DN6552_c0_g1_i3:72-380(-)
MGKLGELRRAVGGGDELEEAARELEAAAESLFGDAGTVVEDRALQARAMGKLGELRRAVGGGDELEEAARELEAAAESLFGDAGTVVEDLSLIHISEPTRPY